MPFTFNFGRLGRILVKLMPNLECVVCGRQVKRGWRTIETFGYWDIWFPALKPIPLIPYIECKKCMEVKP